jgi:hypothetical protein
MRHIYMYSNNTLTLLYDDTTCIRVLSEDLYLIVPLDSGSVKLM